VRITSIIQTIKNKIARYEAYLDEEEYRSWKDETYNMNERYSNEDPHVEMYENTKWHECMKDPNCDKAKKAREVMDEVRKGFRYRTEWRNDV